MSTSQSTSRTSLDRVGTFVIALIATVVVLLAVAWVGHEVRQVLETVTTALDGGTVAGWVGSCA